MIKIQGIYDKSRYEDYNSRFIKNNNKVNVATLDVDSIFAKTQLLINYGLQQCKINNLPGRFTIVDNGEETTVVFVEGENVRVYDVCQKHYYLPPKQLVLNFEKTVVSKTTSNQSYPMPIIDATEDSIDFYCMAIYKSLEISKGIKIEEIQKVAVDIYPSYIENMDLSHDINKILDKENFIPIDPDKEPNVLVKINFLTVYQEKDRSDNLDDELKSVAFKLALVNDGNTDKHVYLIYNENVLNEFVNKFINLISGKVVEYNNQPKPVSKPKLTLV